MTDRRIAPDAPAPELDEQSAPFWAGLAERRIVIQVCTACERRRFPRMPACPYCAAPGGDDVEVAGTGTVYSFVRAAPRAHPGVGGDRPLRRRRPSTSTAAAGCSAGSCRPTTVRSGTRVSPVFVDHATWTELCFQVVP